MLRPQHKGAGNDKNGSRHEREKQPGDASNHENPPKSDDGDALEWFPRLGDPNLLHSESPILQLLASPRTGVVLNVQW